MGCLPLEPIGHANVKLVTIKGQECAQ